MKLINYFFYFFLALVLAATLVPILKKLAWHFNIVDNPDFKRKIHTQAIPLLGGVAIFIAFFTVLFLFPREILQGNLTWHHWLGFAFGGLILIIGGVLDDKYNLKPYQQIIAPVLAIIAVLLGGVGIEKISNPIGGFISLATIPWLSSILIFIWLLGMMYTTKLLDGVDGLVSGVSGIGALIIFLFTLTTRYYQPDIAFAAIVLTGATLGFLIFNFNPASIFLGEGGSLFLGYALGVLAIISGGKIAIALLIMGIPILDVVWTIWRRVAAGRNPFSSADRQHLHHRLLDAGLNQKQTAFIFYLLAAIFGLSGLFLQSQGKLLALGLLLVLMFLIVVAFSLADKQQFKKPALLFHVCCAPCAAYSTLALLREYQVTWYFDNSNLSSSEEYEARLFWVKTFAEKNHLPLIIAPYEHGAWLGSICGHEADPEKGARCFICYRRRLAAAARLAKSKKFDFFSTSLLVSPYKDTAALRNISRQLSVANDIAFLDRDFQADNGYRQSQDFAKKQGFYRQKFCGCEFSKK